MRKLLSVFLAGCLLLLLPATIWASAETTYESEQGQAMIKAPSSASPNASANTEADADSSDDSEGTLSPSGSSSGMDWSAANTASTPSSGSRQFTVCIDPGHQGSWVDMSAQEPMAPGSSQTKNKATTGTAGNYSKVPEYEVNLEVSLVLEKELTSRGYKVVMTREDNDKAISNKNVQNSPQNPAPISRSAFMQTVTTVLLLPVLLPWHPPVPISIWTRKSSKKVIRLHPVSSTVTAMPPALQTKASSLPTI